MKKLIRKSLPLLLLVAIGAYFLFQNPQLLKNFTNSSTKESSEQSQSADIVFTTTSQAAGVLGATAEKISSATKNIIEKVTDEQEEALINKTVENISRQVKDLPEQQAKKIKIQFCQDVIQEAIQEETQE